MFNPISYFNIFDEELLYSAIARFQLYTGLSSLWIQENIFGNRKVLPKVYIPNCLEYFYEKYGEPYTPKYILKNHSVYNFYSPFASLEDQNITYKQLLKSDIKYNPAMHIGVPETDECRTNLKYCCECVKEDIEKVGVPFFHISHNLKGIIICHKHLVMLKEYPVQQGYTCLLEKNISYDILSMPIYYEYHTILAKLSYELINCDAYLNRKIVAEKIRTILCNKGFILCNGNIDQRHWSNYIKDYYGNGFFNELEIPITDSPYCWTKRITRDNGQNIDPILYLLTIKLLSGSIREFVSIKQINTKHKSMQKSMLKNCLSITLFNHKKMLMETGIIHPDWTRTDLKNNCGNAYFYVNKYDKEWIDDNMPVPVKKPRKEYMHKAYDIELDNKYLLQLMNAYEELLLIKPAIPIKRYTLEKKIGKPHLLAKNKYSISLDFVNSVAENTEDFRYRKCVRIVDEFFEVGIIPTLHQVKVQAKIKEIIKFETVRNKVELYINEKIK